MYGRSVRAGAGHFYTPFGRRLDTASLLWDLGMSETIQPADGEIETWFFGGPAFGVNLLARSALVRFVRYGMVSPTLVVLIDGLPYRKMCLRARIYAMYGRSVRAGAGHFYTPFGRRLDTASLLWDLGMSETIQPADGEIETWFFIGGPAFGVNLLARAALVRFVRYGMVSPTLVVLIDGLPVPFQAWTR